MKRLTAILTLFLAAQVALVIYSYSGGKEEIIAGTPLVALDVSAVDHIIITDSNKKRVTIEKNEGNWILPDRFGVAADGTRIERFLENLSNLKTGWPVATTHSASTRFHVAVDNFKVKIKLQKGGDKAVFYLGDSAGARSAYLRMEGSGDIYRSSLAAYDFAANPDKWLDSSMLKLDAKEIAQLQLNDMVLLRKDDNFYLKDAKEGETDFSVAGNLVTTLANLVPDGILGAGEESAYNLEHPEVLAVIKKKDGSTLGYRFAKKEKGENDYVLKISDSSHFFKIARWRINTLLDSSRELLLKKTEEEKTTSKEKK